MNSQVCADASLLLKLALAEEGSQQAMVLWMAWRGTGREVVAPPLLRYEVTSVLRSHVQQNRLTPHQGSRALAGLLALPISFLSPPGLHQLAWELAERFHRPNGYDSHYLALAQTLGCELWTADQGFYQAVHGSLPWVHSLAEAE